MSRNLGKEEYVGGGTAVAVVNWKLVGMGGDNAGTDLWKVEDAGYIWSRIAGRVLTGELLKLDVGIVAEKDRQRP